MSLFDNLMGNIVSIPMCMQNFITIFHSVQEIGPFSLFQNLELGKISTVINSVCNRLTFFRIWTSAKTQPISNIIWQSHGYILPISMWMQNFILIFHSVKEIAPLSLFQNLELGKASTNEKCHFAISWARSCQYQCLRYSLLKYSTQLKR